MQDPRIQGEDHDDDDVDDDVDDADDADYSYPQTDCNGLPSPVGRLSALGRGLL